MERSLRLIDCLSPFASRGCRSWQVRHFSQPAKKENASAARRRNRTIAAHTLEILKAGSYQNARDKEISLREHLQNSINLSRLFPPSHQWGSSEGKVNMFNTQLEVIASTTLQCAEKEYDKSENKRVCVLNFASAKNPGGGFENGAQAQEESLARSSGLIVTLRRHPKYYSANLKEESKLCVYTDHMILSPCCPVFKNDEGELLDEPYFVDFITCPAVNAGVIRHRTENAAGLIEKHMKQRLAKILSCAQELDVDCLILGAYGCGVFANNPDHVAAWFRELLAGPFRGMFRKIVFAIYDPSGTMVSSFERTFKDPL